jgi:hypothetical protein
MSADSSRRTDLLGGVYAQCGSVPSFLPFCGAALFCAFCAALDLLDFAGRISGSGEPDCEEDEDAEEDAMSAGKKYMIGSFWHQTTRGLIWKFVYSTTKEVETGKKNMVAAHLFGRKI